VTSFVALPAEVADLAETFEALAALVEEHRISFCDGAIREVRDLSPTELHPQVRLLAGGRREPPEADFNYVAIVQEYVPGLEGAEAQREIGAPWVLAQALELRDHNVAVQVVSEDVRPHPDRPSVAEGCARLGLDHCRLRQCLVACGVERLLR
jgi:hypothetical protein